MAGSGRRGVVSRKRHRPGKGRCCECNCVPWYLPGARRSDIESSRKSQNRMIPKSLCVSWKGLFVVFPLTPELAKVFLETYYSERSN